jgi:pimeloyl-ACP methyl ester carboxylesterase
MATVAAMIVLVHGVPESAALWDRLRPRLDGPSTALALPGFACPRPDGFGATEDDYAAWLVGELETIGEPVDLVGHDWGAALTYRVATTRGDLLRSWSADVANVMHPRYTWHDFAQIWQTEGAGEEFFASQSGVPAGDLAAGYEAMGVPAADTGVLVPLGDPVMASCIMDLYRSATPRIFDHWGDSLAPTTAPGLVLHAAEDDFGDEALSDEVAALLGARRATLSGVGHWWALQDPAQAATVLNGFHASVG